MPSGLGRLPWSSWHLPVVIALGITWLPDGLERNLAVALVGILDSHATLGLSDMRRTGWGAATLFPHPGSLRGLDRGPAFAWNFWSFALFRGLTGSGIGGEYAAIDSAVDELIAARLRGRVAPIVNGTFWGLAAAATLRGLLYWLKMPATKPEG